MKLNIGCGNIKKEGYVNLDIVKTPIADVVADICKKIPFKDNTADEIYSRMTLEHVRDFDNAMKEIYRISKNNAKLDFTLPFCMSYIAYHPDHCHFFNHHSFDVYCSNNGRWAKGGNVRLKIEKITFQFQPYSRLSPLNALNFMFTKMANKYPSFYTRLFAHIYPAYSLRFQMRVLKENS